MTIKEVEELLEVPRATVRFYEKEGLINPQREGNRYRDYSAEDVEQLKKIIIFRKAGLSVSDIADLFDGAKQIDAVLEENLANLRKQMEELKGSINLCKKIKEDSPEIDSFNSEVYWNYIEEEEKKGNAFIDIAKELAYEEKKIIARHLGWGIDRDGNIYNLKQCVISTVFVLGLYVILECVLRKGWNLGNAFYGIIQLIVVISMGNIIELPIYIIGKKYPWVTRRKGTISVIIASLILIVVCTLHYLARHQL
ncbi:MAG: MerR family transcriptional regulator [Butyrivibrio sp.]|nr:MerR family transcriptional regulator [Butyrivibrio sp.]